MLYSEPYNPPPPVFRPAKRRNLVPIVAVVLLGVFVAVGTGFAYFLSGAKAVVGAKMTANHFLSLVEKRKYREAANQFSGGSEEALTGWDDVRDMMTVQEKRRGKAVRHSGPHLFNVRDRDGVTVVRLVYREKFANQSEVPIEFFLKPRDGKWQIEWVQFVQ